MTMVDILSDGTVFPPLKQGSLLVRSFKGNLQIGRFELDDYLSGPSWRITEPINARILKNALTCCFSGQINRISNKQYPVYFVCPPEIAEKAHWMNIGLAS